MTRQNLLFGLLALLLLTGCAKNIIMNIDGMPIHNYEYVATNEETGLRVSYILTRYYKHYEDDEFMMVPEYLDMLDDNVIDPSKTESLILHIKVVNLEKTKYSVWHEQTIIAKEGRNEQFRVKNLYNGKLTRKDLMVMLPLTPKRKVNYRITFERPGGEEIFTLPPYGSSYSVKGGVEQSKHQVK